MWTEKTFAELGYTYTGLSGKNKVAFGSGEPYIPYMNVFSNESVDPGAFEYVQIKKGERQNTVTVGDALFTTSSETPEEVGMSSVLTEDVGTVYLNSFCFGLRFYKPSDFDPKFLSYALRSERIRKQMLIAAQGSTRHNLSKQNFNRMKLRYPTDTKEQSRIAAVLTAADEAITVSRALVDKYAAVKQGLMQGLLTGGIRLPGFDAAWEPMKMSDLCYISSSPVNPQLQEYCNLPHIGNENIEKGTGMLLQYHTAKEDGLISGKYYFEETDVLYGKIRPHLMKACYPRFTGLCSADMYPLRCTNKTIPEYLLYVLLSEHFTRYTVSVSMRSGMPKINRAELYSYERLMPSREEQIAIAEILTAAAERLTSEREQLRKLEDIKRGLMNDLLTNSVSTDKLQGGV